MWFLFVHSLSLLSQVSKTCIFHHLSTPPPSRPRPYHHSRTFPIHYTLIHPSHSTDTHLTFNHHHRYTHHSIGLTVCGFRYHCHHHYTHHLIPSTLPYPTLPYPTLPYPTLPYSTLLYPTLPYPTLLQHRAQLLPGRVGVPGVRSGCVNQRKNNDDSLTKLCSEVARHNEEANHTQSINKQPIPQKGH
jgi:hypothetical protein